MLGKFKYTDTELKTLLNSIVILIDTREQENSHITDYLAKKKIPYKSMKLDFGDYAFMVPKNEQLQIMRDVYFTDNICIERKADLIELIGNLCEDGGTRLENEFIRSKDAKFYLMIENATYYQAVMGNYEISPGKISKYKAESLIGRIKAFEAKYGIIVHWGGDSRSSGNFILHTFRYWLREQLKRGLDDGQSMPV